MCGPCCSHVPTGMIRRGSRSMSVAISAGRILSSDAAPERWSRWEADSFQLNDWFKTLAARRRGSRGDGRGGPITAGAALLSASQWLHAPSVEYLVPLDRRYRRGACRRRRASSARSDGGRSALRSCSAVAAALADSGAAQSLAGPTRLGRLAPAERRCAVSRRCAARSTTRCRMSTATARGRSRLRPTRAQAFDAAGAPRSRGADETRRRGLSRRQRVRVGRHRFARRSTLVREGTSVVATSVLSRASGHGAPRRTTARRRPCRLLDAAPPADGLSAPLTRRIASETRIERLHVRPAHRFVGQPRSAALRARRRTACSTFAPRRSYRAKSQQRITERVRARAGLAFLLALACFVIGVWRGTRSLSQRVAALAVGLACTALVPLNQYSNLTRLFDPAVYFTPKGGPLTGNAGALATTSAIVLLGDSRGLSPASASRVAIGSRRRPSCSSPVSVRFFFASSRAASRFRCTASTPRCG